MKKTKVIFWMATVIIFLFEGVMPALTSQTELAKEGIRHLGYPEYRSAGMMGPVIGNSTMTLGYLLTNNPLAAILSHVAMHVTAVLHGPASVVQLPPHY